MYLSILVIGVLFTVYNITKTDGALLDLAGPFIITRYSDDIGAVPMRNCMNYKFALVINNWCSNGYCSVIHVGNDDSGNGINQRMPAIWMHPGFIGKFLIAASTTSNSNPYVYVGPAAGLSLNTVYLFDITYYQNGLTVILNDEVIYDNSAWGKHCLSGEICHGLLVADKVAIQIGQDGYEALDGSISNLLITDCAPPTFNPTPAPTNNPTPAPSDYPTYAPTKSPTHAPTKAPTKAPTPAPTAAPTQSPTFSPTQSPTKYPTRAPTKAPTGSPSQPPTNAPSFSPTAVTQTPTNAPTISPSMAPTHAPTITWSLCEPEIECVYIVQVIFSVYWDATDEFGSYLADKIWIQKQLQELLRVELDKYVDLENTLMVVMMSSSIIADVMIGSNDKEAIDTLLYNAQGSDEMKIFIGISLTQETLQKYNNSAFNVHDITVESEQIKPDLDEDSNSNPKKKKSANIILIFIIIIAVLVLICILFGLWFCCKLNTKHYQQHIVKAISIESHAVSPRNNIWAPDANTFTGATNANIMRMQYTNYKESHNIVAIGEHESESESSDEF